jgi:predicted ATPase
LSPRPAGTRGPAAPLTGREAELARLQAVVDDLVVAGRGQVLLALGEAGLGKTRMLQELRTLAADRALWLESRCLPYGAFFDPFADILRRWLGVAESDPEVVVRTKARARLTGVLGPRLAALLPSFGRLLRLRLDDGGAAPESAGIPDLPAAYAAWIEALAAQRPVVVALDDLDAAGEATGSIAGALLEVTDTSPVLLAYTLGPERHSRGAAVRMRALTDFGHRVTELRLRPLAPEAAAELLDTLAPAELDEASRAEILARAEGNPLYLEQLLKTLGERGTLERHRTLTLTLQARRSMPPALEGLLLSRIDLLPASARRLAQVAAVVGRDFPAAILERLEPGGSVDQDLAVLLRAEVIRERRRYPEREYSFEHGLLRDAALSTLTPARRRELYAAVAGAYEQVFAASLDQHAEVLAHYYAQSENDAKALEYLERAAEHATALNAEPEAAQLWRRAEEIAGRVGDTASQHRIASRLAGLQH